MFSSKEELSYLCNLCLEAARWKLSEGEELTPLELEIKDRIARLTGHQTINKVGVASHASAEPEVNIDYGSFVKEKDKHARYAESHVRVTGDDGKKHWYPKEECVQVPVTTGGTGWKWVLKKEVENDA